MQIAGRICKLCKRNIVLSAEGKFCAHCDIVVHRACEMSDACAVCGRAFQEYAQPSVDPAQDAILPRALRSAGSGGPVLAILLAVVAAALAFIVYFALMDALANGH